MNADEDDRAGMDADGNGSHEIEVRNVFVCALPVLLLGCVDLARGRRGFGTLPLTLPR